MAKDIVLILPLTENDRVMCSTSNADISLQECVKKLDVFTEAFFDLLRNARWHYELWKPTSNDQQLLEGINQNEAGCAFVILRMTLYLDLVQKIANLIFDKSDKAASLYYFNTRLTDKRVIEFIRKRYISTGSRIPKADRGEFFDNKIVKLKQKISSLLSPEIRDTLKTLRDQCTAHSEVILDNSEKGFKFQSVEGVCFGDERKYLDELQSIQDLLFELVLSKGFSWESFYTPTMREVEAYWRPFKAKPFVSQA